MKKSLLLASIFLLFSFSSFARAKPGFGPLSTQSQNPLFQLFIQSPNERAGILGDKHFLFEIQETVSNIFEKEASSKGSSLDLDMELYQTNFIFSYGLGKYFETGMKLPFLSFNGGFLDSFLQGYHHTFGFPNGGREEVANGRLSYVIQDTAGHRYAPKLKAFGLGNLEFYFKTKIAEETRFFPALSLRHTFKIPTGRKSNGLGSGTPDLHFNLSLEKSYKILHSYTNIGVSFLGGMSELDAILHSKLFTFSQSFEVQFCSLASVLAQVQGTSPYFHDTGIVSLDKIPLDLVIGFKGKGNDQGKWEHFRWEVALAEDLLPSGPSVDFSAHFKFGLEF